MESAAPPAAVPPAPLPASVRTPRRHSLFLVGFLAWLVPGLGQLIVGQPRKALVMLLAIAGLYAGGLALTGFLCVDIHEYRLEFVAHALAGGPTLLTLYLTEGLTTQTFYPHFDVGRLYVAIAGLLNVVAVSDALGDAIEHNVAVDTMRAQHALDEQRRIREAAEAEADDVDGWISEPGTEEAPADETGEEDRDEGWSA